MDVRHESTQSFTAAAELLRQIAAYLKICNARYSFRLASVGDNRRPQTTAPPSLEVMADRIGLQNLQDTSILASTLISRILRYHFSLFYDFWFIDMSRKCSFGNDFYFNIFWFVLSRFFLWICAHFSILRGVLRCNDLIRRQDRISSNTVLQLS